MFVIAYFAYREGDTDRLVYGSDMYGLTCGQNQTFLDQPMGEQQRGEGADQPTGEQQGGGGKGSGHDAQVLVDVSSDSERGWGTGAYPVDAGQVRGGMGQKAGVPHTCSRIRHRRPRNIGAIGAIGG
eukprot:310902-Chlamydomonas_euryale.AAC.3